MLALGFRSFSEAELGQMQPYAAGGHRRYKKLVPGETVKAKKKRSRWAKKNGYVVAATFTVLLSYLFGLINMAVAGGSDESKKISIIQANIGTAEKWGGTGKRGCARDLSRAVRIFLRFRRTGYYRMAGDRRQR